MRRYLLVIGLCITVMLAGCGAPGLDDGETDTPEPEETEPPEDTEETDDDATDEETDEDTEADDETDSTNGTDTGDETPADDETETTNETAGDEDTETDSSNETDDETAGDEDTETDSSNETGDDDETESDSSNETATDDETDTDGESDDGDDAATQLDDCTVIDEPGTYELSENVITPDEDRCIEIESSDVVLDGDDALLQGDDGEDTVGVAVADEEGETAENVTIRDLRVENWGTGVQVGETRGAEVDASVDLEGVDAEANQGDGVVVTGYTTANLTDVTASENGEIGIDAAEGDLREVRGLEASDNGDHGMSGYDVGEVTVEDVTVTDNDGAGVVFTDPLDMTATDVTATGNGEAGISIGTDSTAEVADSYVAENGDYGVEAADGYVTLQGTTIEANDAGGVASNTSITTFEEAIVRDNGGPEVYSMDGNVSADALVVGDSVALSFTDESVTLDDVDQADLPERPENATAVGDGVDVSNAGDGLDATFAYNESAVDDDEDVAAWHHDGDEWYVEGSSEDDGEGTVTANLPFDGVYAPIASADGDS